MESITEIKCREYSEIVEYKRHCGITELPSIIGGVKAALREFPHMAVIGYGFSSEQEDLEWLCGGSLISEDFVLSAAHCKRHQGLGPSQRIKIGIINLEHSNRELQELKIIERFVHPDYNPKTKYHDIMLLKLENSVIFTEFVRPACLNTNPDIKWKSAIAIGFGYLNFDNDEGSDNLMKVRLGYINNATCQKVYSKDKAMTHGVISGQFCAGYMIGLKDTCQGDSGGALQLRKIQKDTFCMYNIIGITSFGKFCGFAKSPGIYTKVSMYIDWIENIVWK